MATILLTGATGGVGRCLVPVLKRRGHRLLLLVRPTRAFSAADRLRLHFGDRLTSEDACWTGDVRLPLCGLSPAVRRAAKGRIDLFLHCAGSIRLDQAGMAETAATNVEGTKHVVELGRTLGIPSFHHLSTVYVAGDAARFSEAEFDVGQTPRNPYEASKRVAEQLVRDWSGKNWSIYRMSILIGDSRSGVTPTFAGYYGFFEVFWRLKAAVCERWRRNPSACRAYRMSSNGIVNLTLTVPCSPIARLNLIPCDWFAETLADLLERSSTNSTYHLVHPDPPLVQWVIETSLAHMGIANSHVGAVAPDETSKCVCRLQQMLDRALKPFLPYVTHGPALPCNRLMEALGDRYLRPPAIDESLLARMLDYAMRVNFGRDDNQ
jgi:nucleoside-diphosphate-sugar epimerase